MKLQIGAFAVVLATVAACGASDDAPALEGTVRFVDVEGGCWTIESGSTTYEPVDLANEFRVDGLTVAFDVEPLDDQASICMVGEIVELTSIEAVTDAGASRD